MKNFISSLLTFGLSIVVASVYLWASYDMYFHQFIEQKLEYKFFVVFSIVYAGFVYQGQTKQDYTTVELLCMIFEHAFLRALVLAILWALLEIV